MTAPGPSGRGDAAGLAGPAAVGTPAAPGGPLTLGTAGHIDHGKTALVRALTGVDTDRLPEEHKRGISIALGYAPLSLPSGRRLSLVDVPGHERFVATMVSGATGIDLYLMIVAADDGVMPQTVEHAAVLSALDVRHGVVAITKADLADPGPAAAQAAELLPDAGAIVACSTLSGEGLGALGEALDRLAGGMSSRAATSGKPLLHVDRAFTVEGIGAVVTGTLWSGSLAVGDRVWLAALGREVRVRGLQVHDEPRPVAAAGQRVAVALAGVRARELSRGEVLTLPGRVRATTIVDCALDLTRDARHNERVGLHHGTREVPARLARLTETLWQLRLEKPIFAADGDRVVLRRLSPPGTLGGGVVLDVAAVKHGRRPEVMARLEARAAGELEPLPRPQARHEPGGTADRRSHVTDSSYRRICDVPRARGDVSRADAEAIAALEAALREAGIALLNAERVDPGALAALRADGRAVRISGQLYAHADVAADARAQIVALIERTGSVSLAEVRDLLSSGRKSAQALLEHLDTERITRRREDDRRVLRGARGATMQR